MKTKTIHLFLLFMLATVSATWAQGYEIGDKIDDFDLQNVDNRNVSLNSYKGAKGFILVFTCNQCPYSVAYEDRIEALHKKYKPKGFPVVAVNPNTPASDRENLASMKKRHKKKGFTFAYLADQNQEIYAEFGATRTPHVYVLEKRPDGLYVAYIGAIDDNYRSANVAKKHYVQNAVEALLKGERPHVQQTKAIGCTIKKKRI
ncbi:hypothetical protein FUAX_05780 [Fulvitalea axinellae]|uniref:Thioredoxin domain-containing protein n=1 Tax=Fulvitalea axinellae TaxID=1182444 RepID=A0AAU9CHB4_9BACT|nr:hypothetical protein FUAX_05780 [Fulvitalea axinellae]